MSDTLDPATLPDQFMVVDYPYMRPRVKLFRRVMDNCWDVYITGGDRWDYHDNVGNDTAVAAFKTNDVYVKVNHD